MRLGYVRFVGEYIVDLDNNEMVEHAMDYLEEDIKSAVKDRTVRELLDGYPDPVTNDLPRLGLSKEDISECCQEFIKKPKKGKKCQK